MSKKILWSSNYGLMDSEESEISWDLYVTAFDDNSVLIDVAQTGSDVHKEFTSLESAYVWLTDFIDGKFLELTPGELDFLKHLNWNI